MITASIDMGTAYSGIAVKLSPTDKVIDCNTGLLD